MNKFDVTVDHHGMKISAIKLIRSVFGFGLKESKDLVEMFGVDACRFVLRMTGDQVARLTEYLLAQPCDNGLGFEHQRIEIVKVQQAPKNQFFDVSERPFYPIHS
jgi:hypothetical protein